MPPARLETELINAVIIWRLGLYWPSLPSKDSGLIPSELVQASVQLKGPFSILDTMFSTQSRLPQTMQYVAGGHITKLHQLAAFLPIE